jgi:hypothetical protein
MLADRLGYTRVDFLGLWFPWITVSWRRFVSGALTALFEILKSLLDARKLTLDLTYRTVAGVGRNALRCGLRRRC